MDQAAFAMYSLYVRIQRLHREAQLSGGVGILAIERPRDSVTNHAAAFIFGLGQHKDKLRNTAPGGNVTTAQVAANHVLQIFHTAIQAALGQIITFVVCSRHQTDMDGVAAAGQCSCLCIADDAEEIILAEQRALGGEGLAKLFPDGVNG